MNILMLTLGCKVNQAETGGLGALLTERGHKVYSDESSDGIDAVIINTCAVTSTAGKKSRNLIRRARNDYPEAILCVIGCLAQTESLDLGIDLIAGSGNKSRIVEKLEDILQTREKIRMPLDIPPFFEDIPTAAADNRVRAFLKIQDGCSNRCAYCRIPFARGESRSRDTDSVIREALEAEKRGIPELCLTGIEISSYRPSLAALTREVCLAAPKTRVRLGSIDPLTVTEAFCDILSKFPNLCPHFHLSLQSCCDSVLNAMGRYYGTDEIREAFSRLRGVWKNCSITGDIIAGFPGETEENHAETLTLLSELRLSGLHVFPFSRRSGTRAADMPGQNTNAVKKNRASDVMSLAQKLRYDYSLSFIGKTVNVLFETEKSGIWTGHSEHYLEAVLASSENLRAKTLSVEVYGSDNGVLLCRITG